LEEPKPTVDPARSTFNTTKSYDKNHLRNYYFFI